MNKLQAYPSTAQFRNATKFLQHTLGEDGTVSYFGTVKGHGTNASMVMNEARETHYQSKNRVLDITHDNSGFMNYMINQDTDALFDQVIAHCEEVGIPVVFPIEIAGEWAGKGIQKGVAISEVEKFFMIFGVRFGNEEDAGGRAIGWHSIGHFAHVSNHAQRVFNACDFGVYVCEVPLGLPQKVSDELQKITEAVEERCPIGAYFDVDGIGEGIVWTPMDDKLCTNPQSWFKVKGQKHSVSKVKVLASVDPEVLESMEKFVEYACTDARLEQGIAEVGLDQKKIGAFVGWVNKDIHKEESDTLEANGLTMKQVGKLLSTKARKFYMAKL